MASAPKDRVEQDETTDTDTVQDEGREVYLRDGKRLTITDAGADQVVEIRGEGGLLELRIRLTEQGPVLQMDAVKLQLKATESVEITAPKVEVATEAFKVEAEETVDIEAKNSDVVVKGKKIWLN